MPLRPGALACQGMRLRFTSGWCRTHAPRCVLGARAWVQLARGTRHRGGAVPSETAEWHRVSETSQRRHSKPTPRLGPPGAGAVSAESSPSPWPLPGAPPRSAASCCCCCPRVCYGTPLVISVCPGRAGGAGTAASCKARTHTGGGTGPAAHGVAGEPAPADAPHQPRRFARCAAVSPQGTTVSFVSQNFHDNWSVVKVAIGKLIARYVSTHVLESRRIFTHGPWYSSHMIQYR